MNKERKKDVKTTVTLARDLWEQTQILAIRSGLTLTEVVSSALKNYLGTLEEAKQSKKKKNKNVKVE